MLKPLEAEGEIYRYAGDEVVITWTIEAGLRDANCVRCFFDVRDAIERRAARYQQDFSVVPRFRGGLHGGPVTGGVARVTAYGLKKGPG